jgi:hypothetical protein
MTRIEALVYYHPAKLTLVCAWTGWMLGYAFGRVWP